MAPLHATIVYLLLSLTYSNIPFTLTTTIRFASAMKPKRLVIKLLHHDFVFYNPNETVVESAERTLNNSIARLIYLSQTASQTQDTQANLPTGYPSSLLFYVNFTIGQPPIQQLAAMDTGSDIVWVNCRRGTFDPSKSFTYVGLTCDRSLCDSCTSYNECLYQIGYGDGTQSEGIMAKEQFTFDTSDDGRTTVKDVYFGCGQKTNAIKLGGVFGLGIPAVPQFSLVDKLGSKFSYCIGNITNPEYSYNKLILGGGAVLEGESTPLYVIRHSFNYYFINLEGISVGEKRLEIDPNVFRRYTEYNTGVIIDSGTSYTFLATSAYQKLCEEIEHLSEGLLTRYTVGMQEWQLCYTGNTRKDLHGFPAMTLHFADGADLVLETESMFHQARTYAFCLAVGPSEEIGRGKHFSLIGILAQQYYNVGYDLIGNRLYFQRIDCDLLVD